MARCANPPLQNEFVEQARENTFTWAMYRNILYELAVNRFKYGGFTDTMNARMLELNLNGYGAATIFREDGAGLIMNGQLAYDLRLDYYGNPISWRAIMYNGVNFSGLSSQNAVLVYNNRLRTSTFPLVSMYAQKLWDAQASADTNVHLQKYPLLVKAPKAAIKSMKTVMQKYIGNEPIIYGLENLDMEQVQVLDLKVPFIAPELLEYKKNLWNEALIFLGIANNYTEKSERLNIPETNQTQGATNAYRETALRERQYALEKANKLFGLNLTVEFNVEVEQMAAEVTKAIFREEDSIG